MDEELEIDPTKRKLFNLGYHMRMNGKHKQLNDLLNHHRKFADYLKMGSDVAMAEQMEEMNRIRYSDETKREEEIKAMKEELDRIHNKNKDQERGQ